MILSESLTTREASKRLGVSLRTVQLWVESEVLPAWKTPGGHRRIPLAAVESFRERQEAAFQRPLRARPGRLDVLLVEDDEFQRALIGGQLQAALPDIVLRSASDGFEALVRAGQRVPDVLVTDILMPGMDGIALLHRLRKVPEFASMRLVVVSAVNPDTLSGLGGLPAGVSFLQKPVDPARLVAAVTGDSVSSIPSHSL